MIERGISEYIVDPSQLDVHGSLANLAKRCGEALEKRYPGWWWTINPDENGGVIYIYALRLSGEWGYTIKIADIQDDTTDKQAIMAGGEILERYNIRRGKYKRSLLRHKMKDLRGNFIPDITDRISAKQKKIRDRELTKAVNEGAVEIVHHDTVKEDGTTYREIAMKIGGEV